MGIDEVVREPKGQRFFIVGGAGFIGSHFTDHLLGEGGAAAVTLYDIFSSGSEWHYADHAGDARLRVVRGNVEDTEALVRALGEAGSDVVIHLASNPDIARAAREPTIDFFFQGHGRSRRASSRPCAARARTASCMPRAAASTANSGCA